MRQQIEYTADQIDAMGASMVEMGKQLQTFAAVMRESGQASLVTDGHVVVANGIRGANDWLGRLKAALNHAQLPHVKDHPIGTRTLVVGSGSSVEEILDDIRGPKFSAPRLRKKKS